MAGNLYIMGGPIGNLEDITLRALRILREEVRFVCCEDTRQTRKLLNHYGIELPTLSFHSHSSDEALSRLLDRIRNEDAAYLTDSGTPCISDPGSRLVSHARDAGIRVIPIPGPSALTAAASVTGFAGKNITFGGFISKKPGRRLGELEDFRDFEGTVIIYESPHRITKTLAAIAEVYPDARITLCRELTKIHEEIITGTATELARPGAVTEKGEFVIAIENRPS